MNINLYDFKKRISLWPKKIPAQSATTQNGQAIIQPKMIIKPEIVVKADEEIISGLIKKSNRILASISTHKIPFDLFPSTINVEEGRVNIIVREFFYSSKVHTVDIKDISNIIISTSPFRAQLIIVSKTFIENDIRVKNLKINQAVYLRRIIEGLRTFETNQIDTSVYTKSDLVSKLKELSKTAIVM